AAESALPASLLLPIVACRGLHNLPSYTLDDSGLARLRTSTLDKRFPQELYPRTFHRGLSCRSIPERPARQAKEPREYLRSSLRPCPRLQVLVRAPSGIPVLSSPSRKMRLSPHRNRPTRSYLAWPKQL